jgi:hypothetical protein
MVTADEDRPRRFVMKHETPSRPITVRSAGMDVAFPGRGGQGVGEHRPATLGYPYASLQDLSASKREREEVT